MVATRRSAKAATEPVSAPANILNAPPKRAPARKKAAAQETATKPAPASKVKKTAPAPKRKAEAEPDAPAPKRVTRSKAAVVDEAVETVKKPAPRARKAAVPKAAPKPAPAAGVKKSVRARAPAPMTTKAALAELPGYPTTPAYIKAPMSNKDGLAELADYPSTPAHIAAPMDTKAALAELAGYPETPVHITAPMSNRTGLAALPGCPTTPAHITAPVSNKHLLAELAGYPTTPAHIQAPALPSDDAMDVVMEDVEESPSNVEPSFMSGVDENSLFIDKEDLRVKSSTPARVRTPPVEESPSRVKPSFMSGVDDNSIFVDKKDMRVRPSAPARISTPPVEKASDIVEPSFMSGVDDNSLFVDKEDLRTNPRTPARSNTSSVARTPLAELPLEGLNTPAPLPVTTPTTIGMGELSPGCFGTPLYVATPDVARDATREPSEAPRTPMTNQQALHELPSYPTTPAMALEAAIQEEITASVKKQTPSPSRFANSPEVSFAPTEATDFTDGESIHIEDNAAESVASQTSTPSKHTPLSTCFAKSPGSSIVRKPARLSDIDFLDGPRPTFEPVGPEVDDFAPSESPSGFFTSHLQASTPEQPTSKLQFAPVQLSAPLPAPEPSSPKKSALRSPQKLNAKTPKKAVTFHEEEVDESNMFLCEGSPLYGLTIFVDVTSNGREHNHVFTEWLIHLGATIANELTPGISHVLFKDGSIATLEKVLESKGAIKCVQVGWAIKCEELKQRVDESSYLVDLTPAMPKSPSPIKMNPVTPARTPSRYALPPSSQCGSLPVTPTSSEIDRSITLDEDKENDASLTDIFCNTVVPRTCPVKKTSVLYGKSAMRTPSTKRNLFGIPRQPLSEGKKRSFDSSSLGASLSVPPKKPRLFA